MKWKLLTIGCAMVLYGATCIAQSDRSAWIGVWQGELDGQPSVTLTLADDAGSLGGTVVFNLVMKENGTARVIWTEPQIVLHPRLAGDTLNFDVIRSRDRKHLEVRVKQDGKGHAQIQCTNCGDGPVADLVRQ